MNGSALQVAVSEDTPGTKIALGIIRNGSSQTVNVTVGEFHKDAEMASDGGSASPQKGKLGLAVAELTPDVRQQLHIPSDVKGVAIQSVRPASPADDASLAPGDVILEVNRIRLLRLNSLSTRRMRTRQARTCCCWSGRRAERATGWFILMRAIRAVCKRRVDMGRCGRLQRPDFFCV